MDIINQIMSNPNAGCVESAVLTVKFPMVDVPTCLNSPLLLLKSVNVSMCPIPRFCFGSISTVNSQVVDGQIPCLLRLRSPSLELLKLILLYSIYIYIFPLKM